MYATKEEEEKAPTALGSIEHFKRAPTERPLHEQVFLEN